MFILYVLECMFLMFLQVDNSGPVTLISTKEPMTAKDVMVGYFGWVILISLIFGILLLIKYLRNRRLLKERRKERTEKGYHQRLHVFTKKGIKEGFILFGMAAIVLVVGIIISIFASDGSVAQFIGVIMLYGGIITTTASILVPLFKYLWRKLDI